MNLPQAWVSPEEGEQWYHMLVSAGTWTTPLSFAGMVPATRRRCVSLVEDQTAGLPAVGKTKTQGPRPSSPPLPAILPPFPSRWISVV